MVFESAYSQGGHGADTKALAASHLGLAHGCLLDDLPDGALWHVQTYEATVCDVDGHLSKEYDRESVTVMIVMNQLKTIYQAWALCGLGMYAEAVEECVEVIKERKGLFGAEDTRSDK